ncbi:MAG: secretin N-terminal domain-containing protein [Akkermansiaceae bacterium]|nr:secretin N-terminal domain-containing protein [Akkermansiaceae bacterium]
MKAAKHLMLLAAGLLVLPLQAQDASELIEPIAEATETKRANEAEALEEAFAADAVEAVEVEDEAVEAINAADAAEAAAAEEEAPPEEEGFIIKDAKLNDIFQFLAKSAGKQYFHNSKIAGPEYQVTGILNNGDPLQQMEELAFMYSLSLHTKGDTIYALTQGQLGQLPSSEFHYQLRYLRPTDVEAIKNLIRPVLTPGTGIVNFEPKTNTIIIIDSAHRIEAAQRLLHNIDKAKGQIIVETKILRVNSSAAQRTGVDWSGSLGSEGTSLSVNRSLNAVFGIDSVTDATGAFDAANLVLSPIQVDGVLRALAQGDLASQVSNPTLITEDNEQASISIIDRIPIITTTTTQATSGGNPTVTEEVRYKIDQSDPSITDNPETHREIGISLVITPTLLPDGTIRMKMRPRTAQITGFTDGVLQPGASSANEYPNVTESMIETLARIPDGHSLVVGGFYGEVESDKSNKIPLLGDLPVINFFFKSEETIKEKTSLVFIVTPTSYDPTNGLANDRVGKTIRSSADFGKDYNWVDPHNPGPAHEPNLQRTLRGLQPLEAPYYPRAKVVAPPPSN